jgi:hypothetical protein
MYPISFLATAMLAGALTLSAATAQRPCDPCAESASCTDLGPGCAPHRMHVPSLRSERLPVLGSTMRLQVRSKSTACAPGLLPISFSSTFSPALGIPLPFNLAPIGFPCCFLYSGGDAAIVPFVLDQRGEFTFCLNVPPLTKYCGTLMAIQALIAHQGCKRLELLASNGLACTIGN